MSIASEDATPLALPYPDLDLLFIDDLLDHPQRERLRHLRHLFQTEVRPIATGYWVRSEFPFELLPLLAGRGLAGTGLEEGSHLLNGLVQMELTRADTSIATAFGVHNELFTAAVQSLGSDAQRAELLPDLLALKKMGCFALTEPESGSDISRALATTAARDGDSWVLNGEKLWIGNGTFADYTLVWARDVEDQRIKGFIVEKGTLGFTAEAIGDKLAARIVQNAHITLSDVRIPLTNALPGATGFGAASVLLQNSRVWVAWQAVGQQLAALDVAREYAMRRHQFGKPIASFQLMQAQLAKMAGNAMLSLSLMIQIARLQESRRLSMDQAALAKANCTALMRETVAAGRAILGGNGIRTSYEMAKIFADAEAIYTYEGTFEVNTLLVGRALTGISAFE